MELQHKPFSVEEMLGMPRRVELVHGFVAEYYLDDAILVEHSGATTREGVDAFINTSEQYMDACLAAQRPALWLFHVGSISLTPYSRQRVDAMITKYKHITGRGAYIFAPSPFLYVMRNFVMVNNRRSWRNVDFQMFKDSNMALQWLYEGWLAWKNQ